MAEVEWTSAALADLQGIGDYIGLFNQAAADRMSERLVRATDRLAPFPLSGRAIGGGRREPTTVRPYLIRHRYDPTTGSVSITEVRLGARRPN